MIRTFLNKSRYNPVMSRESQAHYLRNLQSSFTLTPHTLHTTYKKTMVLESGVPVWDHM
jgi:hypothetical protein